MKSMKYRRHRRSRPMVRPPMARPKRRPRGKSDISRSNVGSTVPEGPGGVVSDGDPDGRSVLLRHTNRTIDHVCNIITAPIMNIYATTVHTWLTEDSGRDGNAGGSRCDRPWFPQWGMTSLVDCADPARDRERDSGATPCQPCKRIGQLPRLFPKTGRSA